MEVGQELGFLATGDPIVVVTGWKTEGGYTNTMRVLTVPETQAPIVGLRFALEHELDMSENDG